MIVLFDILALIVSVCLMITNIKRIRDGSRYIIFFLFWFIFVLPLLLDYIVGEPIYASLSTPGRLFGFTVSAGDEATRIIYDIFIILTQMMILKWRCKITFGHNKGIREQNNNVGTGILFSRKELHLVFFISSIAPLLCVVTGRAMITYTFGWRELSLGQSILDQGNYSLFEKLSYIGVVASAFLLFWNDNEEQRRSNIARSIIAVLFLYSNVCVEGKRSILFFALIMCLMIQIYFPKGRYALIKLALSLAAITVVVVVTSIYVKTTFRGYSSFENLYTTFRVDLFRDDTVKMVIYSFLGKQIDPLLNWPFQSYITQLYSIFPLDILTGFGVIHLPHIGFNVYLSATLAQQSIESGINFMTTSIADELIANFSYFGFLFLGPILVGFARFIDQQSPFEKILWIGAVVLLMIYPLNYIAYYIEAAVIIHIILKRRRRYYNG